MSIYKPRSGRPVTDKDAARPGTRESAPAPAAPAATGQDPGQDWTPRRKAAPANYLLPRSLAWLRGLPEERRPLALAARYPRIVNVIALLWDEPTGCRAYFDDLLVDHRGRRKGFPADVHRDLRLLRDYYGSLHPTGLQIAPDE